MKTPQLLYMDLKKAGDKLRQLHSEVETLEVVLQTSLSALAPPEEKKTGMLASMNPMANMPDFGAVEGALEVLPAYLEKRAIQKAEQQHFNEVQLEITRVLIEQHLQEV